MGQPANGNTAGPNNNHPHALDGSPPSWADSRDKQALVDMAKMDRRRGVTRADMDAYDEINRGLSDPFPSNRVRLDEGHARGAPHSRVPHGHVGQVDHIPIVDP
jgi:hypothetical protein